MKYYVSSRNQLQLDIPGIAGMVTRDRFIEVSKKVFYGETVQNLIKRKILNYKITGKTKSNEIRG